MRNAIPIIIFLLLYNFSKGQSTSFGDANIKLFVDGGIDGSGDITSVTFKEPTPITIENFYLFPEWNTKAILVTKTNRKYQFIGLNYNTYSDNFEMKVSKDSVYKINSNNINKIEINESIFKNIDYDGSKGFFEILFIGKEYSLLKKYGTKLILGKLNPLNGEVSPNTYNSFSKFYLKKGKRLIPFSTKKKTVLYLFQGKEKVLNKYIKKQKLSLRKEEDLIKLFIYANTFD